MALPPLGSSFSVGDLPFAAEGAGGAGGGWGGLSVPSFLGGSTQMGLKTALGRAAPWTVAGLAAQTLAHNIAPQNSVADVLGNTAAGAGVGAGIGSLFGPGPGTAIGAGAGALIGGGATILGNIFGGDNEAKPQGKLGDLVANAATGYQVSPDRYRNMFETAVKLGAKDAQGNPLSQQQIAEGVINKIGGEAEQIRQADYQSKTMLAQHEADLKYGLALQTQARDFFSPYTNNIIASGASQAKVLNSLADQVPGPYKGVFQAQAANALSNAQQMAGAYAAQTALMPAQLAMAQYGQQQEKEIANQAKLFQYASQMMGRQQGGGGADLVSQLQQAGGQYNASAAAGG